MTFVTSTELANHMGRDFTAEQQADAEGVLAALQGQLELYLNRDIEPADHIDTVWPDSSGFVYLRTPVLDITTATVNGVAWDVAKLAPVPGGVNVGLWLESYPLVISYRSGIDSRWDQTLRTAILRAAAREMTHNHDDTLTMKDLSTTNEGEPTTPEGTKQSGFSEAELRQFSRLKRRVVV